MYLKGAIKSNLEKSNLKIFANSLTMLKENKNFNKLINIPGKMTDDEQCKIRYFLGKRSDDPDNVDWIPTAFNNNQARTKSKIIKVDQRRKIYKSICEKRAIISVHNQIRIKIGNV